MSRGRPFEPGNKFGRGRPKGSRNKLSPIEQFLKEHEVPLCQKGLATALRGNPKLLVWYLEKLFQIGQTFQKLKLPPLKTSDDVAKAVGLVLNAVANRTRSAPEGQVLLAGLDMREKSIQDEAVIARLEEVERRTGVRSK